MSNYFGIYKEIRTYLIARVPLIIVDTSERERAERILRELATELLTEISFYTDARQVEILGRNTAPIDVDNDPLSYAAGEFRKKRGNIFALADARRLGDDCTYSRELLNVLYLAQESGGTVILVTPDPVWQRLAQFGMMTRLDLPDLEERTQQICRFVKQYQGRYPIEWTGSDISRAAALLRGFSEIQIGNILAASIVSYSGLTKAQIPMLTSQKSKLYASVPAIEQVSVPAKLEVSGLENLKAWLQEKQQVFFAPDDALAQRGLETPKGILLAGVPGCGKSLSAKMVAKTWELPLFRFDIGAVYDKWVGESEKKMREALRFLDNVAPCVVWVDEIEKGLSVSSGGNDTGHRVLGQFLFWLQESGSRVFLVATANDISALPAELFRKGRFSETFFVDLPNEAERRAAILQYCRRSLLWTPQTAELDALVGTTRGFSYADIEYCIKNLAQQALLLGDGIVSAPRLMQVLKTVIPFAETNPDVVEQLHSWGSQRAVPASSTEQEEHL